MGHEMDRRQFAALVPALLGMAAVEPIAKAAQTTETQTSATAPEKHTKLSVLTSGTFRPGVARSPQSPRVSQPYLLGMLAAGNIRLEMHETTQVAGAAPEAVGTHLHNEIWCMREGVCELNINGVAHRMEAGDVGLVTAGDKHYIKNIGDGPCSYFVVTIGPPEG